MMIVFFRRKELEALISLHDYFSSRKLSRIYFALAREIILKIIYKIQHAQTYSIEKFSRGLVANIIEHAFKNIAHWHKLSEEIRNVHHLGSLHKIESLPILERNTVAKELNSVSTDKISSYALFTSGTSGPPVKFYVDSSLFLLRSIEIDYIVRMFIKNKACSILRLSFQDMPWSVNQGNYIDPLRLNKFHLISFINEYNPMVLYGTVSHITLLADFFRSEKIHHQFVLILTRSEYLDANTRQYFESTFCGKTYNMYASREFGVIAQECSKQKGLHINEERVLVEIVDDNGRKIPINAVGNILITSPWNRSLPFIRYKIGDRGKFLPENCSCGLKTKLMEVAGRISDFVYMPSGKKIPYINFLKAVGWAGVVKNFQFLQESSTKLTVKVVLYDEKDRSRVLPKLAARFKESLDKIGEHDLEIRFELTRGIPLSSTGKLTRIVQSTAVL